MVSAASDSPHKIPASAIRDELFRILSSQIFAQSERLGRFLTFTVESVLAGKSSALKEYVIGTEVYDRKPPYQPSQDSIVRSEARRLRSKLKEYYESEGRDDPVLIYFRPGSYVPVFRLKQELTREPSSPSELLDSSLPPDNGMLKDGKGMSIAVIPFRDLSGQPASSSCAVAITDELIHALMRTEGCRVTSASSSAAMERCGGADLTDVARRMGVQIFFEGSVRQEGQRLRVTARLITSDGFQLWSQRFDTEPEPHELFAVSEQIARSLVNRTRPEISAIRKLRATAGSIILDTYPRILGAEALIDEGTPEEIELAVTRLEEILEIWPHMPRPLCDIAQCCYELALRGAGICSPGVAAAKQKVLEAAEIDPEFAQVPGCTAALALLEWDWKSANEHFRRALALGSHAATFRQYSLFLVVQARFDEGWHYLQKAQDMDPFSKRQKLAWARFFHVSRRHGELKHHLPGRSLYGPLPMEARLYLALSYIDLGQLDQVEEIVRQAQRDVGSSPAVAAFLAEVLARSGHTSEASELAARFKLVPGIPGVSRVRLSFLALALADYTTALLLLQEAAELREPELIWITVDPRFDPLRDNPDFIRITETVIGRQ
jgi:TolB-like protein